MGIPMAMRDAWVNRRNSPLIASPAEDQKILNARRCTEEGVRAGLKAASIACVASAVPTRVCDTRLVAGDVCVGETEEVPNSCGTDMETFCNSDSSDAANIFQVNGRSHNPTNTLNRIL